MHALTNGFRVRTSAAVALLAVSVAFAGAAQAAPSQKSMRKAFAPKLAGTWGDVYSNGAEPGLPDGWAMFGCGEQPALVISGSDKAGFVAKMNSMELGPVEGQVRIGDLESKTSGRITLPNQSWEQKLTFKNSDSIILDAVGADADKPSANARYLRRCR